MVRAVKRSRKGKNVSTPRVVESPDVAAPTIFERPDGYYWSSPDGGAESGPYESYELAQAARDAVDDQTEAPGEALLEAEREIGIADWIDAETGEPAEGQSPPHLQEE